MLPLPCRIMFWCLMVYTGSQSALAQNKNDFIWILGTPNNIPDPFFGGDYIDFSNGSPVFSYIDIPLDMWYPNIMSDETGQLSFYTNGCKIMNAESQLIENGDEINIGYIHNIICNYPNHPVGYPSYQGQITLPSPGHPGEYFYFHMFVDEEYKTSQLLFTSIDMNANGGSGKVIQKNQLLLQDTFSRALTATRHANGRDWWILAARKNESYYYIFLLDPLGIHGPFVQQPESNWITGQYLTLSNIFSPDGAKYVRVGGDSPADFRIYDFDRCSGSLSNAITVHLPDTSTYAPWACFSPNSRFLYVQNSGERLYQFDTWAGDISASVQLVGVYDGFLGRFNLPTSFNSMTIGPDQRIYMSCGNGSNFLHTIHDPNEPGVSCNFIQHDVEMPAEFPFYLPNFPNYRLYNIPGSPCDSLGIIPPMEAFWRSEPGVTPLSIEFTDISYYHPISWHWYFGDGTEDTIKTPVHYYATPGFYDVCLVACNGEGKCDTLCRQVEVKKLSSTYNVPDGIPLKIFPNPVINDLNIIFPSISEVAEIRIFDLQGKMVYSSKLNKFSGLTKVDVSKLSAGVYLINLQAGVVFWNGKFMKT